jgi:hypothetical protein
MRFADAEGRGERQGIAFGAVMWASSRQENSSQEIFAGRPAEMFAVRFPTIARAVLNVEERVCPTRPQTTWLQAAHEASHLPELPGDESRQSITFACTRAAE